MKPEDISWVIDICEKNVSRLKPISAKYGSSELDRLKQIDRELAKRAGKVKFKRLL